jgi:hypothetical protein
MTLTSGISQTAAKNLITRGDTITIKSAYGFTQEEIDEFDLNMNERLRASAAVVKIRGSMGPK